jgi:hypothetical protein
VWYETLKRKREDRDRMRISRRSVIQDLKTNIIRDLALGHNLGDFDMDPSDLSTMIRLGPHSPLIEIEKLYEKYRGSKIYRN